MVLTSDLRFRSFRLDTGECVRRGSLAIVVEVAMFVSA